MPGVVHFVSLQNWAGVETHFAEFLQFTARKYCDWNHTWLNPSGPAHPNWRATLSENLSFERDAKRIGPLKLPSKPDWIRARNCRRMFRQSNSDVALIWNRTARSNFFLDGVGSHRAIHWEHGEAWHDGREQDRSRYLRRIPLAITNSIAARRVLELKWGFDNPIAVCRNALRPSLVPKRTATKKYPYARAIKLGVVARLQPVKGVPIILHALKTLLDDSVDVELHVAGDGPDREHLCSLAQHLGVGEATLFHGTLENVAPFYAAIDCLVHVPLTEAFGLAGIEAAAHGCPVVATAVDGLPESVKHGVSGYCVKPSLPMSEYQSIGGSCHGVPQTVFDPASNELVPTMIVSPSEIAHAVKQLISDKSAYAAISQSASQRVLDEFRFEAHVDQVMDVISGFALQQ